MVKFYQTLSPFPREIESLDAFNYFIKFCGHVRTVYCYCVGNYVILKALVNPSLSYKVSSVLVLSLG